MTTLGFRSARSPVSRNYRISRELRQRTDDLIVWQSVTTETATTDRWGDIHFFREHGGYRQLALLEILEKSEYQRKRPFSGARDARNAIRERFKHAQQEWRKRLAEMGDKLRIDHNIARLETLCHEADIDIPTPGELSTKDLGGLLLMLRLLQACLFCRDADFHASVDELERAIAWSLSRDPQLWTEAIGFADDRQKIRFVTALVARMRTSGWQLVNDHQWEVLFGLLRENNDEVVAETAFALGVAGEEKAVEPLRDFLRSLRASGMPLGRKHAVRALGQIKGETALTPILGVLKSEMDVIVLDEALHAFRQNAKSASREALESARVLLQEIVDDQGKDPLSRLTADQILRELDASAQNDGSDR